MQIPISFCSDCKELQSCGADLLDYICTSSFSIINIETHLSLKKMVTVESVKPSHYRKQFNEIYFIYNSYFFTI